MSAGDMSVGECLEKCAEECVEEGMKNHHHSPIIGYHRAPLSQKFGAPRQPNLVPLTSVIEMLPPYDTPAAFVGLDAFSHIWLSWQFHHNHLNKSNSANTVKNAGSDDVTSNSNQDESTHDSSTLNKSIRGKELASQFRPQVRPPRLGGNQKIGVFASRSMYRPSALGLSVVRLERVDVVQGRVLLTISGADMVDGTPIIDIKPYVAYSDALPDAKSGFASDAPVLSDVLVADAAHEQFMSIVTHQGYDKKGQDVSAQRLIDDVQSRLVGSDIEAIKALIAQDPRPAYRRDQINVPFVMRYKSVDVSFQLLPSEQLKVTSIAEVA